MDKVLLVVMGALIGGLVYKIRHRRYLDKCMRELDIIGEILQANTHEKMVELYVKYPHLRRR